MDINRKENTDFIYDPTLASSKQKTRMDQKSHFSLEKSHDLTSLKLRRRKQRQILENEKRHALVDEKRRKKMTEKVILEAIRRGVQYDGFQVPNPENTIREVREASLRVESKEKSEEIEVKEHKDTTEVSKNIVEVTDVEIVENNVAEKSDLVSKDNSVSDFKIKDSDFETEIEGFIPDSTVFDLKVGDKIGDRVIVDFQKQENEHFLVKLITTQNSLLFNCIKYDQVKHVHVYKKNDSQEERGFINNPNDFFLFAIKGKTLHGNIIKHITDEDTGYGFYRQIITVEPVVDPILGITLFDKTVTYKVFFRKELL